MNKNKKRVLQFIWNFLEMDEDMYLLRLKEIRDKYATPKMAGMKEKETEVGRENPQRILDYPRFQMVRKVQPEQSRVPFIRQERSYSLTENALSPPKRQSTLIGHESTQKRMENFNSLIRDLDQRIQEKERIISSRCRGNGRTEKSKDEREYEICKTISRYSSSKDISRVNIQQPSRVPREAYERSIVKREEIESRRVVNQNIENVLERKWGQENMAIQKGKIMSTFKENRQNKLKIGQYQSPLGISKQDNLPSDLWSIGKLDNIQQRIKSVLKRAK